jgi:MipA family protein
LGGFDLAKIGAPLEPVRFAQSNCPTSPTKLGPKIRTGQVTEPVSQAPAVARRQLSLPRSRQTSGEARKVNESDVFTGDYAIVGVGVGTIPTYEGSDSSRIMPVPGAMGRVRGVEFRIAGPSLTLDIIKGKPGAKFGVALGPTVRYRFNRSGNSRDEVVDRLGKLKGVIELGVNAGFNVKRVISKHDILSVSVSARWDASGRGSGVIVSPSATYLLPVSKAQVVGALVSAEIVDQRFARYNYSVTPAGSAASGLPEFSARGGLKSASAGLFTARDLNGNILDGGFALGAGVLYTRLHGSAANTPITRLRGSRNQWIFGGGLAYTF